LDEFFRTQLSRQQQPGSEAACLDMWEPYRLDMNLSEIERCIKAIKRRLSQLAPMHSGSLGKQNNA